MNTDFRIVKCNMTTGVYSNYAVCIPDMIRLKKLRGFHLQFPGIPVNHLLLCICVGYLLLYDVKQIIAREVIVTVLRPFQHIYR